MAYEVIYGQLHYFILGICEIIVNFFLIMVVHNTATVSEWISYLADNDVLLFLPVYFVIINILLFIGVCISIEHVVGYYVDDVLFILCHWYTLRVIAESTSVFFLHAGFGRRSARESFLVGFFSTSVFAAVLLLCYFFGPNYVALIVCGICILLTLFVYHIISWLLPLKYFHRRPAAKHFSLLNAIILLLQILALFAASVSPNGGHNRDTAVKFFFTVTEIFQIMINLFAFSEDSMYWQGLFVDDNANLNHPLLGVWEMNSGVIHTAVSRTITQLERKVVKIIPYSHLSVDTSKYFAGGSARVYKGFYDREEVAIKFLFCIELTPDRVVDFCNEATLLNSLQHPNVVKCFGVAIMPPAISLVTEYCSYGSLFDFLHSTDLVVNEGDHRASLSSGSDGRNRVRTSTSDSLGRERTSTSSGRYRANSRLLAADALGGSRDSFGAGGGVGSNSGRYRAHSRAVPVDRDSLSSVNSKSINLEFARRDSEPVVGHAGSADIEQGAEGTTISPLQQQHLAVGPNTGGNRSSAGKNFTFSFNWASGANSTTTPITPLHNPVRSDSTAAPTPSSDGPYPNEHLVRYMDAESMDIAARLAEAMTNKTGGGVGLSQKHSHEPHSRNNSLRWPGGSNSYRLPRLPSLPGGAAVGAAENKSTTPPPPASSTAEPKYFAPVSTPTASRIRSATSVLLSKDMGFGLGPQGGKQGQPRNRDSTGAGVGVATSTAVTPGAAAGTAVGGVRTYSVSRPSSPAATPQMNKRGSKGSKSNSKSKSRLSSASLLVGLISPPSVHSVGRLLPPATKLRMARDCCAGLAFLHSKNLMHCDIKSLNFLVCSDLTVKLSDLGETRLLGDNHYADSSSDQRDMPVNTNWSSPELLSGQRHLVNQAADVWSLAMVIVEIMTGEVPYDTPEYRSLPLEEFIHRLKANERPSLPKVFLQSLWLEDLLYDAWHFDPALRCSAESMLKIFDENLQE